MKKFSSLFAVSLLVAGLGFADDKLTAEQIAEKANAAAYFAGDDGRARVTMTIEDGKGGQRSREFTILRMNVKNDQKFYVYFEEPADVRRMAYLVWKYAEKDADDRWLWLPALNLVKRIAPGDKRTSFVGSDFVYEDVSGRALAADKRELVETTDTQYVLKNTPKDLDSVEFSSYTVWIDKDSFLPRKAEYVDRDGKVYRRVEAVKVEKVDGFPTVMEAKVTDVKNGSSTTNVFTKVEYNIGLKENLFTERFLRRPPREVR